MPPREGPEQPGWRIVPASATRRHDRVVERAAQTALCAAAHWPLRSIVCKFDDGVLMLIGQVPSYYLKQVAHVAVSEIDGVNVIDDRLEVID